MLLDHDFLANWEEIVKAVDKDACPMSCVRKVIFRLQKGQKTINLRNLRRQGFDDESIEQAVSTFIEDHEEVIRSMELVLDVEAVAEIVQPETDKLLKGM